MFVLNAFLQSRVPLVVRINPGVNLSRFDPAIPQLARVRAEVKTSCDCLQVLMKCRPEDRIESLLGEIIRDRCMKLHVDMRMIVTMQIRCNCNAGDVAGDEAVTIDSDGYDMMSVVLWEIEIVIDSQTELVFKSP